MGEQSAARLAGDDYQHLYSWFELLQLLSPESAYTHGYVEHPRAGAADDITLHPKDNRRAAKYVQVKFHVDHSAAYSGSKLVEVQAAEARSVLTPAGEISAAFAILDFFNNQLRVPAVGKLIYPHYVDAGQNLVVLGSGIEEHHYSAPADLGFSLKNFANGVEETNGKKHNDTVSGTKMKVHVLLQRWQTDDGSVVTVIYGSHAAAIEQVVKKLVSEKLAASLIKSIPRIHWLRRRAQFECLIAVELDTTGKDFVLRSFTVVKPQQRRSHSVTKMRHPQEDLEKGA